jgi:RNA polymerase sigma factor (sigma-70 family)
MRAEDVNAPIGDAGRFATTHWSVVLAARRNDDERSHEALSKLCQTYWYPLYAFVRRQGYGPEDAQDLTQGFFAHLLERHALAQVDRTKGKFRSFLLASLRHFLSDQWDSARAQKRGSGAAPIALDAAGAETRYGLEAVDQASPDQAFDRNWALALMEQVLAQLRAEQEATGKQAQFALLQDCLMGDPEALRYVDLAAQLGVGEGAVKMAVSRLRRRYRDLLRHAIAHTVTSPAEAEEEIQCLFAALES